LAKKKKQHKKARNQQFFSGVISFFLKVMTVLHKCFLSLLGIIQQVATKQQK